VLILNFDIATTDSFPNSAQLTINNWQLAMGNGQWAAGNGQRPTGNWQLAAAQVEDVGGQEILLA